MHRRSVVLARSLFLTFLTFLGVEFMAAIIHEYSAQAPFQTMIKGAQTSSELGLCTVYFSESVEDSEPVEREGARIDFIDNYYFQSEKASFLHEGYGSYSLPCPRLRTNRVVLYGTFQI